ncbi:MAG: hypothetical protein B1H12_00345, partial [Desulfobacteraceae bacterium 4484_190.2]
LGLFNLVPIPPLDGSHVLENLLPLRAAQKYREFGRYGAMIILGIVILDNFAHTGILSRVLIGPMKYLAHLFSGINLIFFQVSTSSEAKASNRPVYGVRILI